MANVPRSPPKKNRDHSEDGQGTNDVTDVALRLPRQPTDRHHLRRHAICLLPIRAPVEPMIVTAGIAVYGRAYAPTWLRTGKAVTKNTVPLSVIAEMMDRYRLHVTVDIISEGHRTRRDPDGYWRRYEEFLRGLPCAGQRTVTLLVHMYIGPSSGNAAGLSWRRSIDGALSAVAKRFEGALNQAGCRAHLLGPEELRTVLIAVIGGTDADSATFTDQWKHCRRSGKTYITSYVVQPTPAGLANVWSYSADHTTLYCRLRYDRDQVVISAVTRYTTVQPIVTRLPPTLTALTGHQLEAITDPAVLCESSPATRLTVRHDNVIPAGPSGVLLGRRRGDLLLLPLSDPVHSTELSIHADDTTARRLMLRARAAGERFDGEHITVSVNNGYDGNLRIEQLSDALVVMAPHFRAEVTPIEYTSEEPWL